MKIMFVQFSAVAIIMLCPFKIKMKRFQFLNTTWVQSSFRLYIVLIYISNEIRIREQLQSFIWATAATAVEMTFGHLFFNTIHGLC